MEKKTDSFENCPKCGAEVKKAQYGNILIEYCSNCKGLFVDYDELRAPGIEAFMTDYVKQRKDFSELDKMVICCPKCKVMMRKKQGIFKKKYILDVCPACGGVWFDQGELNLFKKKMRSIFLRAAKLHIKLICPGCGVSTDYNTETVGPRKCPRCGEWLSFEGMGEVFIPRIRIKHKTRATFIMLVVLLGGIFALCHAVFKSIAEALFFTATFGVLVAVIIIRAIVYNRFAWAPGRGPGPSAFYNFPLSEDDE